MQSRIADLSNMIRAIVFGVTGIGVFVAAAPVAEAQSCFAVRYFEGWESTTDDWAAGDSRVATGSNGIASATGGYHAEMAAGAYTRWGGYSATFPANGFTTSVDVYLDMATGALNDTRFDWSSAISNAAGAHRRDFVLSGGFYNDAVSYGTGNRWVFTASNTTPGWPRNPARSPYVISTSGWYTFEHRFYDNGSGVLAVDISIKNASGTVLTSWTLSDATDIIGTTVGGNRYGWLVNCGFSFLAFDNAVRFEPATPPTVNAGADQTVYDGYDPMSCAELAATVAGGTSPFTYEWTLVSDNSVVGTGASIEVCPTATTAFMVTVTDANGCSGSDVVAVNVVDVHCGSNMDKVSICHNGNTICVNPDAVPAHLDHGDAIDECQEGLE